MVEFTRQILGHDMLLHRGATVKAQPTLLQVGNKLLLLRGLLVRV